ncbi:hypothetical protein DPEC_G00296440 [Dallia pectoralis]|uniref:Uncharacterized protein n=1 Tax=Dallia pectoralis TaxID=75939 RepID=A0ACC2FF95_DALPE|nr:hypothetical protein DPEC_G00296440 [Dallia pectoralis]
MTLADLPHTLSPHHRPVTDLADSRTPLTEASHGGGRVGGGCAAAATSCLPPRLLYGRSAGATRSTPTGSREMTGLRLTSWGGRPTVFPELEQGE